MKVFVQVVDTKTGVFQSGIIEEPTIKGMEITNALTHFGIVFGETEWDTINSNSTWEARFGKVSGTSKIVNTIVIK